MQVRTPGVHWAWWVFWLLVFWPALFLVWITHKNDVDSYNLELQRELDKTRKKKKRKAIVRV